MALQAPIGFSDFVQLRRQGLSYVDKSALVTEVIRASRLVLLFPRPRRFGKTLNLTMLRAFFEPEHRDDNALFAGLEVERAGPDIDAHRGQHPVIFLSFKDVKHAAWSDCRAAIEELLAFEARWHRPRWDVPAIAPEDRAALERIAARQAPSVEIHRALALLCAALATATGQQPVILLDEYDTPVHAGFVHGYADEVVGFLRILLAAGLKDNPHLYRGVLTGILRVAKESIFSGLNNVDVHSVLSHQFSRFFGFTEAEVMALADAAGAPEVLPVLRDWYDGYRIGATCLYNPWSVLCQLARPEAAPQAWWVNTASDDILVELLVGAGLGVHDDLAALIGGAVIHRTVTESLVLRDIRRDPDALWSFLLFSGYLTLAAEPEPEAPRGRARALRIPNREVAEVYRTVFQTWLRRSLSSGSDAPSRLAGALLRGDAETFEALLERLMTETLSSHDLAVRRPEAVYQAFLVGLLVQLETTHDVRSNRESGHGRYDVSLRPRHPGQPGAVLELKVIDERRGESVELALDRAMAQIEARDYATELRSAGASPIWSWAAVFDGKRVWVRAAEGR